MTGSGPGLQTGNVQQPSPSSETNPLSEKPVVTLSKEAQELVNDLQKYITTIEGYKENYAYGFWFAPSSRAINRQANYELAKWLRNQLQGGATIDDTFSDVESQRTTLLQTKGLDKLPDYVARGINSKELNNVIEKAHGYLKPAEEKGTDNKPII